MLTAKDSWVSLVEVNPPQLPNMSHLSLQGAWKHVLVTDNVFGKIRVSPYAHSARITHDVPSVEPTVVVSTRDRNILAIESEVRGALGNGVDSFLVVIGDTVPAVDHLAHHFEIVEHLRGLQGQTAVFEVGMPTRFREWQFRQRIESGAQFFVSGPVLDPDTVEEQVSRLGLQPGDPPVLLMVAPPFSPQWVERAEGFGTIPATDGLKQRLAELESDKRRPYAWDQVVTIAERAANSGCRGLILVGLKYETAVGEAAAESRRWDSH